jgi:hypothetical protein
MLILVRFLFNVSKHLVNVETYLNLKKFSTPDFA